MHASVMLETVLTIHFLQKSRPDQDRSGLARGQAGRSAGQPAREQETNKGKNRRRAMQSAGCTPNRRREKSVRLTGRDKPCRQLARAAHPPSFPPFHPQPYHGPRGLRWVRRCMGVEPLFSLSLFLGPFFSFPSLR